MALSAWPRPGERVTVGGDAGPWAGIGPAEVEQAAGLARPLRRLLGICGYDAPALYLQATAGARWARLDLATWIVEGADVGGDEQPQAAAVVERVGARARDRSAADAGADPAASPTAGR